MRSAQDQFRQKSRKICESQLHIKEDVSKQLNADPKDLWQIKLVCEGEKSASGNDTDVEENVRVKSSKCRERYFGEEETRKQCSHHKRLVQYSPRGYTSAEEEERCCKGEHCCGGYEVAEGRCCGKHAQAHRMCEGRSRQAEKSRRWMSREEYEPRRMSPKGKCPNRGRSGYDCGDLMHRCEEWCSRYRQEEPRGGCERSQPAPVDKLIYSKPYTHVHHKSPEPKWKKEGSCHQRPQQTAKVLDSYEELPAVDESQEPQSDVTYKPPSYTKFSKTGDSETEKEMEKRKSERSPTWLLCDRSLNTPVPYGVISSRTVKKRSRRTRMNRSRDIKWKKALIHPVVEGSKKEMVGVMVWGQSGPEYYSKITNKKGIPFRKSRSFPEDTAKSYDLPLGLDLKEVFCGSDPGRKLRTPETDTKIEESIAKLDKNLEEIVKNSQEKFMQSLAKDHFQESKKPETSKEGGEGNAEVVRLMPYELLSSRAPKSMERGVFAFNVESKMVADNLNERAKQFRMGEKDTLTDLEMKFPAKPLEKEKAEANLALWGMNMQKQQKAGGEGDGGSIVRQSAERKAAEEITDADMEKLSEEMHRERRKKYHETAVAVLEAEKALAKKKATQSSGELFDLFRNLVKDGCAITEKESENLQKILVNASRNGDEASTTEVESSCDTYREMKKWRRKSSRKGSDECVSDGVSKKHSRTRRGEEEGQRKKRHANLEKMKLKMIREALPSMAAENEAAHLRQLKKYIHRFIDEVEHKISSSSEMRRRAKPKNRDSSSSESGEVKVDAKKLIDLVSNPFRRITSDMTIDMAKKLTDALVQENSYKSSKKAVSSKTRKNSDGTEDASIPCPSTSGSDRDEELEPAYLEGLKKIRNTHLSNIIVEVRRLKELLRFLDRCNRLKL
ncbi:UNVERIFIED_CONTAM: hypothetical protein PYX00_004271 [Menopon gallinae]|uniref:Uncharacterized protein n=1 Tax=Menopon gallinae TaxID=328185 RepID=A0AAW2I4J6_9NEOP